MGTTLTGTKPKDTYDSLIKVGDNGPISGTAKTLSDGLGNDLPISVSSTAVGIGTSAPATQLHVAGTTLSHIRSEATSTNGEAVLSLLGKNASAVGRTFQIKYDNADIVRIGTPNPIPIRFETNDVERLRILSDGGLTFNGDTAQANALDDYEEGTWTPTIVGNATAGTATYTVQQARYTKIGRMVQYEFWVGWNSGTGTGGLQVSGLPFTAASSSTFPAATIGSAVDIALTADHYLAGYIGSNTTTIALYEVPTGGGANNDCPYDAAGQLIISGTYSV
jgi:hypothetical protein